MRPPPSDNSPANDERAAQERSGDPRGHSGKDHLNGAEGTPLGGGEIKLGWGHGAMGTATLPWHVNITLSA